MRSMQIEHFLDDGGETVVVDGNTKYLGDRPHEELHRLTGSATVLTLEQRQVGFTQDGEQHYCSDDGESVVVDASPDGLREIGPEVDSGHEPEPDK